MAQVSHMCSCRFLYRTSHNEWVLLLTQHRPQNKRSLLNFYIMLETGLKKERLATKYAKHLVKAWYFAHFYQIEQIVVRSRKGEFSNN